MTSAKTREKQKQIKNLLVPVLEEHIWPLLQTEGFSWRRSLRFLRGNPSVRQTLEFVIRTPRRRNRPVLAHICPWITVRIPRIGEQTRKLLGEENVPGNPDIVLHQSAGRVGPDRTDTIWLFFSEEDLSDLGHCLAKYVKAYVLPFLNRYQNPRDIVEGWESGDERLAFPPDGWIQLAAACLEIGRKEQAAKILWSKVWGKAELREKYRHALDLLGIDPSREQYKLLSPFPEDSPEVDGPQAR